MPKKGFAIGKVPPEYLKSIVFKNLGKKNPRLILGPKIGEDAAIIRVKGKDIVVASDPITGSTVDAGWLAVHVNANDIATHGAQPTWMLVTVLLPVGTPRQTLQVIMDQMNQAALELNVTIAGGHTEITPVIKQPVIIGFMIGETIHDQHITTSGAKTGDHIILTKGVGLEGTAILASERSKELETKLSQEFISKAIRYRKMLSVLPESKIAVGVGGITSMHDPTEGGISGALHELADASNHGFLVEEARILVRKETEILCKLFHIDPLELISSGALLITVTPEKSTMLIKQLENANIHAQTIGEILEDPNKRQLKTRNQTTVDLHRPAQDALWKALKVPI